MDKAETNVRDSSAPILPNFVIVGAAKAGTTSLYYYLSQHPDIFMSPIKEPEFFVDEYGMKDFPRYAELFSAAQGERAIGEASTDYLYRPESAQRIRDTLGPVKIIIVLREPSSRAYSQYIWAVREGFEDSVTFEQALRRESKRLNDPELKQAKPALLATYAYFDRGLYAQQVKRYLDTFGNANVRIYLFEDLVKTPLSVCEDVFNFLGVDPTFSPSFGVHNKSVYPLSVSFQVWLRNHLWLKLAFIPYRYRSPIRTVAAKLFKLLMRVNKSLGKPPRKRKSELEALRKAYSAEIMSLEALLNRKFDGWYSLGQSREKLEKVTG